MISIAITALAGLTLQPAAIPTDTASYGNATIGHMKGQIVPAATEPAARSRNVACHPDPQKGRSCRIHVAKTERQVREDFARSGGEVAPLREAAP